MNGNNYRKKRLPLFIIALIICAFILCFVIAWFRMPAFEGTVAKDADAYEMEIQMMTGTDRHTMELKEGDVLQIQFETVEGSMHMEIKAPDGTVVYSGNGKAATDFSLKILKDGVYTIAVEARRAKGNICINLQKAVEPDTNDAMTTTAEDLADS